MADNWYSKIKPARGERTDPAMPSEDPERISRRHKNRRYRGVPFEGEGKLPEMSVENIFKGRRKSNA